MTTPILAIDDDPQMCELLKDGLRSRDYAVESSQSGDAALALARERDFEAVVTDLKLAHRSGLDICRELHDRDPHLPVVVITGFGDMQPAHAREGTHPGCGPRDRQAVRPAGPQ